MTCCDKKNDKWVIWLINNTFDSVFLAFRKFIYNSAIIIICMLAGVSLFLFYTDFACLDIVERDCCTDND